MKMNLNVNKKYAAFSLFYKKIMIDNPLVLCKVLYNSLQQSSYPKHSRFLESHYD